MNNTICIYSNHADSKIKKIQQTRITLFSLFNQQLPNLLSLIKHLQIYKVCQAYTLPIINYRHKSELWIICNNLNFSE